MKAGDVDAWISENLTDPLHGAYSRGSEAILAKRLMEIRGGMAEKLYASLGPGASTVQKFAQRSLRTREVIENLFGMGTSAKPSAKGASGVQSIRTDTGQAQTNRAALEAYDAEYGTNFLQKFERLSMTKEWSGDVLSDAYAIDSILQPTRPGLIHGAARKVARGGARATKYAGPTAAASAAFYSAMSPRNNP
jgi:hypothetical protein